MPDHNNNNNNNNLIIRLHIPTRLTVAPPAAAPPGFGLGLAPGLAPGLGLVGTAGAQRAASSQERILL